MYSVNPLFVIVIPAVFWQGSNQSHKNMQGAGFMDSAYIAGMTMGSLNIYD